MMRLNKILSICIPAMLMLLLPLPLSAADSQPSCSNSCEQLSECKPSMTNGLFNKSASCQINPADVKKNSDEGCFNSIPVSGNQNGGAVGHYNSVGNRGSNRNHYGTDIGVAGLTSVKAYPVADGGTVAFVGNSTGGGRTVVINFTKKCSTFGLPGGGGHDGYHVVYRHLAMINVSVGQTVDRKDPIGIVGGSNLSDCGLCDNPAQGGKCGSGCYYAIHLHMELEDGTFSGSGTKATPSKIMTPYCQNANILCGGCPSSINPDSQCSSQPTSGFSSGGDNYPFIADSTGSGNAGSNDHCDYADYLDSDSCTFCEIFKKLFNAASIIAKTANDNLAAPSRNLVIIGFLIWMCIFLLKFLLQYSAASNGEILKGILFQGFRVAVVVLILGGSIYKVMDLTLNPVMKTGMSFVQSLNSASTCPAEADYLQGIVGYDEHGYDGDNVSGGLSVDMGRSIVCSIKNLEDATGIMMNLGKYSLCLAGKYDWFFGLLPNVSYSLTGLMLLAAGAALLLMFPWCLIDCILQLCIAAALTPCAIAAYAFKITAKYLYIIWNFFMNAMFNFVFLAIIVYIINFNLSEWLGLGGFAQEPPEDKFFISFDGLFWVGVNAIKITWICFLCWVFFDEAKAMAKRFADAPSIGGQSGIGRMVGGTLAQMGTNYAAKPTAHFLGKGLEAGASGINSFAGVGIRSFRNHAVGAVLGSKLFGGRTTTDANNNPVYQNSFRLMGRQFDIETHKGENGKWSMTRESHYRSQTDKAFEVKRDADGNVMQDENGNTIYQSRHRIFGITTGKEDMVATRDSNGNLVYSTEDGRRSFTMNEEGEIATYRTPYTRTLTHPFDAQNLEARQFSTKRTVNDAYSTTHETLSSTGESIGSSTRLNDVDADKLVKKDGTIDIERFNRVKNSMNDSKAAAAAMISTVMEKRGAKLNNEFQNRKTVLNSDGSVTITQLNKDGSSQVINAKMVDNQMIIRNQTTAKNGNITINTSNGMQFKHETLTKENGQNTYKHNIKYGFTENVYNNNRSRGPLNANGEWGFNIDRDQAMRGFTQEDYDRHLAQLKLQQYNKIMTKDEYNRSEEVRRLNAMLNQRGLTDNDLPLPFGPDENQETPDGVNSTESRDIIEQFQDEQRAIDQENEEQRQLDEQHQQELEQDEAERNRLPEEQNDSTEPQSEPKPET